MRIYLMIAAISGLVNFSAQAFVNSDIDLNEIDCYNSMSKITCSSDGYWSGENFSTCSFSLSYKSSYNDYHSKDKIKIITSHGYQRTDTGFLGFATLGATDALMNQRNAIAARREAKKDLKTRIRMIKTHIRKCQ